jgi:hypothetical protein
MPPSPYKFLFLEFPLRSESNEMLAPEKPHFFRWRPAMSTLIVKDLATTEELDRTAMAAMHGGMYRGIPAFSFPFETSPVNFTFDASQMLSQTQNVMNNNGNNVAFASGITSTVNPSQNGSNNIKL